jgi:hypothetical protein
MKQILMIEISPRGQDSARRRKLSGSLRCSYLPGERSRYAAIIGRLRLWW